MFSFGSSPRRRVVVAGLCVAVVGLTIVITSHVRNDGPHLVSRTDGSTSGAVSAPGSGRFQTVYAGQVCMSEPGSARIRSIEPVEPHGGLEVTDFSVIPEDAADLGQFDGRLRDAPIVQGSDTVSDVCGERAAASRVYLEVRKPRAEDAWATEYRIDYDVDGTTRSARLRYGFGVCESDLDHCDHDTMWTD